MRLRAFGFVYQIIPLARDDLLFKPLNVYVILNSAKRDKMLNGIFRYAHYLIVDEVSMIGNTNINQIHSRLNQIYGKSGSQDFFGGINMIFVGDLFQIPPVQQTKIFDPRGLAALGINLWKDLVTFSELTDVVRSKGDQTFTNMCHRLRTGNHSNEDLAILKQRVIDKLPPISDLMDTMLLFSTNAKCKDHNNKCVDYLKSKTELFQVNAFDKFSNEQFNNNSKQPYKYDNKDIKDYICNDINKTAGLPTSIALGVGARVMVRANIDVTNKICNGVCGTLKGIKFKRQNLKSGGSASSQLNDISVKEIDKVYIFLTTDK